ncbi:MAG TPA: hypothetical protein VGF99_09480 [Myxococcota bacterium]
MKAWRAIAVTVVLGVGGGGGCGVDPEVVQDVADQLGLSPEELAAGAPADIAVDGSLLAVCDLGASDVNGEVPTLLPVPTIDEPLPARCDEAVRRAEVIDLCGPVTTTTSAADTTSIAALLEGCGPGTCVLTLPAGRFVGDASVSCAVIEGVGDDTLIRGTLSFNGPGLLAGVRVEADYGAVSAASDVFITRTTLVAGYEAFGAGWDQDIDVAICRSRLAAGYSGAGLSWSSKRLTVAGSSIVSCSEGVSLSWNSSDLHVAQNVIVAGYSGVSIHESVAVAVIGNVLWSAYDAVSISSPPTPDEYGRLVSGVLVRRNDVRRGALPASDAALNIVIER